MVCPGPAPIRYRPAIKAEIDDPAAALGDSTVLLAFQDETAVGIVVISGREIKRLFVSNMDRGHGVGRRLLDAAVALIPGEARLTVWRWRTAAIRLYEQAGFVQQASWEERDDLVCLSRRGWNSPRPAAGADAPTAAPRRLRPGTSTPATAATFPVR